MSSKKGESLDDLASEAEPLMRDIPDDADSDSVNDDDPTPRRSHFWRRFGIPWAWGYHHGGTTN